VIGRAAYLLEVSRKLLPDKAFVSFSSLANFEVRRERRGRRSLISFDFSDFRKKTASAEFLISERIYRNQTRAGSRSRRTSKISPTN